MNMTSIMTIFPFLAILFIIIIIMHADDTILYPLYPGFIIIVYHV